MTHGRRLGLGSSTYLSSWISYKSFNEATHIPASLTNTPVSKSEHHLCTLSSAKNSITATVLLLIEILAFIIDF